MTQIQYEQFCPGCLRYLSDASACRSCTKIDIHAVPSGFIPISSDLILVGTEIYTVAGKEEKKKKSDGSTASYYELPKGAKELQDLISHKDMNAQMGEIFRACYRYGEVEHSSRERDLKKIIFYAQAEQSRLSNLTKE